MSIANKAISDPYHYSYSQMSDILTAWSLAYAFGQIFNGLLTDRIHPWHGRRHGHRGRKMTGFSSGLIDSFQYFGSSGGLWLLGRILDRWSWHYYFYYMVPFGLIGFLVMVCGGKVIAHNSQR